MVDFSEVERVLKLSFEDYLLSSEEKSTIRESLANFNKVEQLNFARNAAFKVARNVDGMNRSTYFRVLKWLEQVIKTIDGLRQGDNELSQPEVFFSPGKQIINRLKQLISNAEHSIDVCVFTISDDNLKSDLIKAHNKGVLVRVLTDNLKVHDLGSDVQELANSGIEVRTDSRASHMHHKFAVVDQLILINGSFNWTRSASHENQENIVVDSQPHLVSAFIKQFEKLWAVSPQL
ncbi:MAG: DUF1669 domain-containing protein [Gammaproteobacteria bacterium]|nr:DUF1669 domain-containing protein [Gammaproteobacteria bacterium]